MAHLSLYRLILTNQWTLVRRRHREAGLWIGIAFPALVFCLLLAWTGAGAARVAHTLAERGHAPLAAALMGLYYAALLGTWLLVPLLTVVAGSEALFDPERYLMYPVHRGTLFALTLLSSAAQPMAWALYAGVVATAVALTVARGGVASVIAPALVAMLGVAGSAAVSLGLAALGRTRRIGEWIGAVSGVLIGVIFLLPNLWLEIGDPDTVRGWAEKPPTGSPIALALHVAARAPTGWAAGWIFGLFSGPLAAVGLMAVLGVVLGMTYRVFGWTLGRPEATRRGKRARGISWLTRLFARTHRVTEVVALKEIAYVLRDPNMRIAIVSPLILWPVFLVAFDFKPHALFALLTFSIISSVMQSGVNLLGRDRSAFEMFLVMPMRGRDILFSKAAAHVVLFELEFAVLAGLGLAVGAVSVHWVLLAAVAGTAMLLFLLAIGQGLSVRYPYPMDPRRRTSAPAGAPLLYIFGMIVVLAVIAALVAAPYLHWGSVAGLLAATVALGLGTLAFVRASDRYGVALEKRREEIRHALLART